MTTTDCAFERLYDESHGRLLRRLHRMTGRLEDAHDLMQETYARAWQHWDVVSAYEEPEAWLHTAAWRLAVNRSRKLRNGQLALCRLRPAGSSPAPNVDTVFLVSALRQLPAHQREAMVLHYLAGLPVRMIAERTGVATGTVKARLSRGRRALARLMGDSRGDHQPVAA